MRQVHSSPNVALINHYRSVLEESGIPCVVRGEYLASAVGEIPPIEAWAELWVVDESRFDDAARLIADLETAPRNGAAWVCAECGEEHDTAFAACWKCGSPADAARRRAG